MNQTIIKNASKNFPNIASWIEDATIEITHEYGNGIVVRAIDEGGTVFENENCHDFNDAMHAMDEGIKKWYNKNM